MSNLIVQIMGKYNDTPIQTVIRLANGGDKEACKELSIRYLTGLDVEENPSKAQYWKTLSLENSKALSSSYNASSQSLTHDNSSNSSTITTSTNSTNFDSKMNIHTNQKYDWAITPDKSKHKYVIGIDFGHGETSAAFCPIGWDLLPGELEDIKDIDLGGNRKVIPSAINIQPNGQAFLGEAAFNPERLKKATVEVCFKKKPENLNGDKEALMIRYMHEVYLLIIENSISLFTEDNHLVYIATPSGWDKEAKYLYGEMARKAGLPIAGITTESAAAFSRAQQDTSSGLPQYIYQGAIVFDMGSSTLDFTYLCEGKQTDFGYDCGVSKVEKIIYENIRCHNEDVIAFEKEYPTLVATLLFYARCAKEKIYSDPSICYRKTYNFDDIIGEGEELSEARMKFLFQPGELNQILEDNGYISEIRNAMIDFKNNHIGGKPIYVAFLTGGASRMNFIKDLVKECWGVDLIYRDPDPSLTISQGVAIEGRSEIRTGGTSKIKQELESIKLKSDIYTPFIDSLCNKLSNEIIETIGACVTNFRDNDTDVSINDLQAYIEENINEDLNQVGDWAMECYKETFENQTKGIRERLDEIVSNYSRQGVRMGSANVSIYSLPNIDMSMIAEQMRQLSSNFTDGDLVNGLVAGIAGAAVGGVIAMLLGGPLAWLIGGGALLANWFFGEEKTEEQKRQEALAKDLDKEQRQKVFDEFNNNWDNICQKIYKSVDQSIRSNYSLEKTIRTQSKATIDAYVKDCIIQIRLIEE